MINDPGKHGVNDHRLPVILRASLQGFLSAWGSGTELPK